VQGDGLGAECFGDPDDLEAAIAIPVRCKAEGRSLNVDDDPGRMQPLGKALAAASS
jgi:hypothetical protein